MFRYGAVAIGSPDPDSSPEVHQAVIRQCQSAAVVVHGQRASLVLQYCCTALRCLLLQRIKQYDQMLGLNSVRTLNPAIQNITQELDAQLSQVQARSCSMQAHLQCGCS